MPLLKDVSLDHLADAVCVITGGTSGIGLAIAERLLSLKSQVRGVVVCSRSQAGVDKAVKQLNDDRAVGMACDATSYEKTLAVMKFAKDKFGSLDYVFANAGSTGDEIPTDFVKEPRAPDVSVCMGMVKGVANAVHAAAPLMQQPQEQSGGKGGSSRDKAIFVSGSESAYVNFSMNPMYAMAKHTANAAAYTYAERLQPYGIRIMTIAFSFVQTKMTNVLDASDCPGGLGPHEWIPIDQCVDMFMQGMASVNQTGTVLRLSGPDQEPREMTCDFSTLGSIQRWAPPFAKNKTAQEMLAAEGQS